MAVGITQPGGVGTDIIFQTDGSAPNGLYYRAQDYAAAFPADFVDLGTFGRKAYRSKVNLINGDGALTGTTTWKDTRVDVYFDNGKTYLVSATGLANRYTEFGLLATGASGEPVGYDGVHLICGANPFAPGGVAQAGNIKLYDSSIENYNATAGTSRVFVAPGVSPNSSDLVDAKIFSLAGTQSFGTVAAAIGRMRRVNSIGLASGIINGHIVQWNCVDSDRVLMFWPNGDRKVNTGSYQRIANPTFIGPSTFTEGRNSQALIVLNPEWSQNCLKPDRDTVNTFEEWGSFGVLVTEKDGITPIAGVRIEIWDFFDKRFVVDTYTNALGTIDFIAPQSTAESPPFFPAGPLNPFPDAPFRNALLIDGHQNDGVTHDHVPFRMHVNRGKALPGYEEQSALITFPYSVFLTTEKQYFPLYLNIKLSAAGAPIVPLEAETVQRILAEVPGA